MRPSDLMTPVVLNDRSPIRSTDICSRIVVAVFALSVAVNLAGAATIPALAAIDQQLTANASSKEILKDLEALPLDIRKTADYHWLLARAHWAANEPVLAAEALTVMKTLDPGIRNDTSKLKDWLTAQANGFFNDAVQRYHKGDLQEAGVSYMKAIRCDLQILARRDEGLGERALATLSRSLESGQKPPIFWYGLAFYNYRFSHFRAAKNAIQEFLRRDPDPYWQWKGNFWLQRLDAEIALESHLKEEEKKVELTQRRREEEKNTREAEAERTAENTTKTAQNEEEKFERQRRLTDLDARIRDAETQVAQLQSQKTGRVAIDQYGNPVVISGNQRKIAADMEELNKRLQDLRDQRSDAEQTH